MTPEAEAAWRGARPGHHSFDTACVAPWLSLEFGPDGLAYGCCSSHLYPLGDLRRERLSDIWNGARTEVLRDALRQWDLTLACGSCRWHLEHERMDPVAAVYDRYPATEAPTKPHMMLFALSNRCNLACVMCNGDLSSRIRAEDGRPPLESPYGDDFFHDLESLLVDLQLAKFLGGEPFLVPEHHRVWDLLVQVGATPRLDVTTNGTVWTDRVEQLLDQFRVDISISVDAATPETYAAVRRGGDFANLLRNLDRFHAAAHERGTSFHLSYCLMEANWHEMFPFLTMAEGYGTEASINVVTDTGLALHDLPRERLESVLTAWRREDADVLHLNKDVWATQLRQLESVLAERANGAVTQPRQSVPVPADFFTDRATLAMAADDRAAERARLGRWAGGETVSTLELSPDGTVIGVADAAPRLGMGDALVGAPLEGLVAAIESATGQRVWAVEHESGPRRIVRTMVVSTSQPARGSSGTIVRSIEMGTDSGSVVMISADRFFEAPVAVRPPTRRAEQDPRPPAGR